ncbi:hypothetical protein [Euzebya sp.]|uniref:hypothetical protein n=1 Tax=Euzebya sp. TaxID=1971409 RepID=UPI003512BCD2
MPEEPYYSYGLQAVRDFLDTAYAGPWREVEARIADVVWPGVPLAVQPHILSEVRQALRDAGELVDIEHATYGGRSVSLVATTNTHRRKGKVDQAIRTKAMLHGRYMGWASGPFSEDYPDGIIGVAGDRVLHTTLRHRNYIGLSVTGPPGDVTTLLGVNLAGGSYDDAAYLNVPTTTGMESIVLGFEMKNIRRWLYPRDSDVHGLLHRSALLQQERPDTLICPVLVTRRRHPTLLNMAKDLGFYAIQTRFQFMLDHAKVQDDKFQEVYDGLGYVGLVRQEGPSPRLEKAIDVSLRRDAPALAQRWRDVGANFVDLYADLRRSSLSRMNREHTMNELRNRTAAIAQPHHAGW